MIDNLGQGVSKLYFFTFTFGLGECLEVESPLNDTESRQDSSMKLLFQRNYPQANGAFYVLLYVILQCLPSYNGEKCY